MISASSLSACVSLSASQIHGLTSTPIASVFQNSDTSTGVASLTWQTRPLTSVSPDGPPKTTHPRGVFLATNCPACLVCPVCIWAWSIPISKSTGPLPLRILSFSSPRSLAIGLSWTSDTSSLMDGIPIALIENISLSFSEDIGTLYTLVLIVSSSPPTFVIVTAVSFPLSPSAAAVSSRIRLICAPESRRVLLCFWNPFCP